MYKEILVYTGTGEVARRMINYATEFASALNARVTGFIVEIDSLDYSEIDKVTTDREKASVVEFLLKQRAATHSEVQRVGAEFQEIARRRGVTLNIQYKFYVATDIPGRLTETARLYDCVLLPSHDEGAGLQVPLVEEALFGAGVPLIALPSNRDVVCAFDRIMIAWDGSQPATRAVHDALPILHKAITVDIMTITDEKPLEHLPTGHDLKRYLLAHDISATYVETPFKGQQVGEQIMNEALDRSARLLIMGGYGHSRLRQLVFGGATRSVLNNPLLPVFLSH